MRTAEMLVTEFVVEQTGQFPGCYVRVIHERDSIAFVEAEDGAVWSEAVEDLYPVPARHEGPEVD
jgi:hypothetical protein